MFRLHHLYRRFQLSAAALAFAGSAAAQVGLGLSPMREEFKLGPGRQRSGALALTNDTPVKVRVPAAAHLPQALGRLPQLLNHLRRVVAGAPQDAAERSYHCAVGFTTQAAAAPARGTGLRTAVQVVGALYAVVGNPPLEGVVKNLKLEYAPVGREPAWNATVVLGNPGWMHFRPAGSLEVLDEAGQVVESAPFMALPVLPKRDQNFVFPLKLTAGPGKYTLRARVDLGGAEIQEATAVVHASKPQP
ncbi:MAG: hypothetical protein LAQ30_13080 [Acidobacteriia bacterium]|nr:hypothetical protein [Terriglobia bacterium]